jgi:hypothetical protein
LVWRRDLPNGQLRLTDKESSISLSVAPAAGTLTPSGFRAWGLVPINWIIGGNRDPVEQILSAAYFCIEYGDDVDRL